MTDPGSVISMIADNALRMMNSWSPESLGLPAV